MGQFLLQVPKEIRETLPSSVWDSAHFCGVGGTPWQTQTEQDGNGLKLKIKIASSGKLQILWPVENLGTRLLSTCTLSPSETQSYQLAIELARGSCYRARTLAAEWERYGITPSDAFQEHLHEGTSCFLNALKLKHHPLNSAQQSMRAISYLEKALDLLAQDYATRSIAQRKQRDPKLGTLLAGSVLPAITNLPASTTENIADAIPMRDCYLQTFNTAAVRFNWRDIEKTPGNFDFSKTISTISQFQEIGLRTIAGPLVDFEEELLPEWILQTDVNFDSLHHAAINYVERTINSLRGSVQLWNCLSGINNAGPVCLNDEQIMRLSLSVLQTARGADPDTPAIISFDQPFGEYLRNNHAGVPALKIGETLVRCGLGLAGIGLDIKLGYASGGSMRRSAMDLSQHLDRWSGLGLPLLIQLSAPGDRTNDPLALRADPAGAMLGAAEQCSSSDLTASSQLELIEPILPMLLAKPYVHGIVWDGWTDDTQHFLPNSGLIDQHQSPRPLQKFFSRMRADHLA